MLFSHFQTLTKHWHYFWHYLTGRTTSHTRKTSNQEFYKPTSLVQAFVVLTLALILLSSLGLRQAFLSDALQPPLTQSVSTADGPSIAEPLTAKGEIRGVWITNVASTVLFAPWGIPKAIGQLAEMHFNTLYPVVWNRGQSFYHSPTLRKLTGQSINPLIALTHPYEDPLQEMVRLGHRQGLRVIPWFEYGFMIPLNSAVARQHPEWLTSRHNGSHQLQKDMFETEAMPPDKKQGRWARLLNSHAPTQLGWLNPMHPSVQGLLIGLIEEVIDDYAVDGIQLDDHFSLPVEFGYDPYTVSMYQAEHWGQSPPNNPADADWIRWRAGKLSKFMNIVHARVKAKCPTCTISVSPNPAKFSYRFHLQDWRTWVRQGWVDELIVQLYRDDFAQF